MVRPRGEPAARQPLRHALGRGPARAVDDPAVPLPLPHERDHLLERLVLGQHPVGQVRPVEAGDEHLRRPQAELADDVLAHPRGGRRGQRHHGHLRQGGPQPAQLPVLGPEVVAPLGHAVCLVDRDRGHVPAAQVLLPALQQQALRRGVQEAELAAVQAAQARTRRLRVEGGVQEGRRDAARLQGVDLVLHQRDQRGDDHREPLARQRRQLEAERLAAPRRQQGEHVLPRERGQADLPLKGAERGVAEGGAEEQVEIGHGKGIQRPTACRASASAARNSARPGSSRANRSRCGRASAARPERSSTNARARRDSV